MAKQGYVVYTADKIKKRKKRIKRSKIIIGSVFLILMLTFVVLSLTYNGGAFTVTLDPNFHTKAGMAIYTDDVGRQHVRRLYANELKFMDNISVEWLPKNYKDFKGGDHNGDNYIAYTFYVENQGTEVQSYCRSLLLFCFSEGLSNDRLKGELCTSTPEISVWSWPLTEILLLQDNLT